MDPDLDLQERLKVEVDRVVEGGDLDFPVSQQYGHLRPEVRKELWVHLANVAIAHREDPRPSRLDFLRRNLMALCTYERWFDTQREIASQESAEAAFAACTAFSIVASQLAPVEKKACSLRLQLQGERYLAISRGELSRPWFGVVNHPEFPAHLAAMAALSRTLQAQAPILSSALKFEVNRQVDRMHALAVEGWLQGQGVRETIRGELWIFQAMLALGRKDDDLWKKKFDFISLWVLPGQENLLNWSGDEGDLREEAMTLFLAMAPIEPRARHFSKVLLARSKGRPEGVHLGWCSLFAQRRGEEAIDHAIVFEHLPASGFFVGRHGRRPDGAFLAFRSGSPGGDPWYGAHREGRPDLDFSRVMPDQGSFVWTSKGRTILGHSPFPRYPITFRFNTLTVDGRGQVFEAGPSRWLASETKGEVIFSEVYGRSWAMGAELSTCYPPALGVKSFRRILIWLGPELMVMVDRIVASGRSELELHHVSPQLPIDLREKGFYQRISGLQMVSSSFPEGTWSINEHRVAGRPAIPYATHSVRAETWERCVVMGMPALVGDAHAQRSLEAGLSFDFDGSNTALFLDADSKHLKVKVRGKTFFDIPLP